MRRCTGKIIWALEVLKAHLGEVEADFHRFYQLDVAEVVRARKWRKLYHLIRYLPAEAATSRELTGRNPETEWGNSEHLLAAIFDVLRAANYQRGGGKGAKPKPIRRPTDPQPQKVLAGEAMTPAELDAVLASRRKPKGDD